MKSVVLLLIVLAGAAALGLMRKLPVDRRRGMPWATLATAGVVATMFAAQIARPDLLPVLARAPGLLRDGEVWRAVTALFVQDGGIAGAVFNAVILLAIGTIAEWRLGIARWSAVYFGGGIAAEFLALAWQPHGAGNSIACFALAGALCSDLVTRRTRTIEMLVGLIPTAAAIGLLFLRDIHGIGFCGGAVIGCALAWRDRYRAGIDALGSEAQSAYRS